MIARDACGALSLPTDPVAPHKRQLWWSSERLAAAGAASMSIVVVLVVRNVARKIRSNKMWARAGAGRRVDVGI